MLSQTIAQQKISKFFFMKSNIVLVNLHKKNIAINKIFMRSISLKNGH